MENLKTIPTWGQIAIIAVAVLIALSIGYSVAHSAGLIGG